MKKIFTSIVLLSLCYLVFSQDGKSQLVVITYFNLKSDASGCTIRAMDNPDARSLVRSLQSELYHENEWPPDEITIEVFIGETSEKVSLIYQCERDGKTIDFIVGFGETAFFAYSDAIEQRNKKNYSSDVYYDRIEPDHLIDESGKIFTMRIVGFDINKE
jgi:hypothetical protein